MSLRCELAAGPMDAVIEKPKAAPRVKLFVATPCFGCKVTIPFMSSMLALQAECFRRGVLMHAEFIGNESLVERARNILAAKLLRTDATHLLFIDADIRFDPRAVFRLLDFDKDVTSAVYPKKAINWDIVKHKLRNGDPEPIVQMGLDFNINCNVAAPPVDGFVQVLDTATGFLLIKRRAIERMWERYRAELYAVNDLQGHDVDSYVAIFACMIDPTTKRFLSEDYSMCRRWQAMGGTIYACLATPLGHTGTYHFNGDIRHRMKTA